MTRRTLALLSLAFVAAIAFVLITIRTAQSPSTPTFVASSDSRIAVQTPSPTAPASADPCHRGGVTYCALNPAVTEATIRSTICVSGWTATIRPPESYTEPLKLQQIASEHLPGQASSYEEDHRMPLELGGAPRDPTNLSPEAYATSYAKDEAENAARREVCARADLRTVQVRFVATWLGPWPAYKTS